MHTQSLGQVRPLRLRHLEDQIANLRQWLIGGQRVLARSPAAEQLPLLVLKLPFRLQGAAALQAYIVVASVTAVTLFADLEFP